jgi:hypothetical protein
MGTLSTLQHLSEKGGEALQESSLAGLEKAFFQWRHTYASLMQQKKDALLSGYGHLGSVAGLWSVNQLRIYPDDYNKGFEILYTLATVADAIERILRLGGIRDADTCSMPTSFSSMRLSYADLGDAGTVRRIFTLCEATGKASAQKAGIPHEVWIETEYQQRLTKRTAFIRNDAVVYNSRILGFLGWKHVRHPTTPPSVLTPPECIGSRNVHVNKSILGFSEMQVCRIGIDPNYPQESAVSMAIELVRDIPHIPSAVTFTQEPRSVRIKTQWT